MRSYFFNKTINSLSKSFYGVDATYGQGLQALYMIVVLFSISVINASASASLLLAVLRQKPDGFLFYLLVVAVLGVILGCLSNLLSSLRKKKSNWELISTNMGAFFLLYFILIFSSIGLVLKINYTNLSNLLFIVCTIGLTVKLLLICRFVASSIVNFFCDFHLFIAVFNNCGSLCFGYSLAITKKVKEIMSLHNRVVVFILSSKFFFEPGTNS